MTLTDQGVYSIFDSGVGFIMLTEMYFDDLLTKIFKTMAEVEY